MSLPPRALTALLRPRLTLAVTLSGAAGYVAGSGHPEPLVLVAVCAGLGLLVTGSTLLNQVQERVHDRLLRRTRERPLATGTTAVQPVIAAALLLMFAGLATLASGGSPTAAWVGLAGAAVYNGLYTPLKRRTSLALLAGALAGALPPLVGWSAGQGRLDDPAALWLAGLMGLWQVPHFWSRHLAQAGDYRRAGFALFPAWGEERWRRLIRLWTLALALATPGLAVFGPFHSLAGRLLLLCCPLLLFSALRPDLSYRFDKDSWGMRLNRQLHGYLACLMGVLLLDRLLMLLPG